MSSSSDSSDDDMGATRPNHRKGLHAADFGQNEAIDETAGSSYASEDESDGEEEQGDNDFVVDDSKDVETVDMGKYLARVRSGHSEKEQLRKYAERFNGDDYVEKERYEVVGDDNSFDTPIMSWRVSLIPTRNTKKLFLVRVKPSKELAVVYFLMRKYFNRAETEFPTVYSAFYTIKGSGFIFVEAITTREVQSIRLNVPNVMMQPIKQVPIDQMEGCLSVPIKRDILRPGQFVRIRRDNKLYESYTNDLAQVINVDTNSNRVLVKLVPRIDYSGLQNYKKTLANNDDDDEAAIDEIWQTTLTKSKNERSKKSDQVSYRPQQDDFDYHKLSHITTLQEDKKKHVFKHIPKDAREEITGKVYDWDNSYFYSTFAYKTYPIERINTIDKITSGNEAKRFVEGLEQTQFEKKIPNFVDNMNDSLGMTTNVPFNVNDIAEIADGEYEGALVRIVAINKNVATVKLVDETLYDDFLYPNVDELRKHFEPGDHVKIQGGQYHELTGEVQNITDSLACILLDNNNGVANNIPVNQLSMTHEINQGQQSIGEYQLFDYVRLTDKTSRGVIWRIENGTIYLLLTSGESKTTTLDGISVKEKDFRARDAHNQPIIIGQTVIVDNPNFRQVRAQVKHIGHEYVFLHNNSQSKYNGLFIAEPRDCQTNTHQGQQGSAYSAPIVQSGRQQLDRNLIGKTIMITSGKFKNQLADVKTADQKSLTVIMHNTSRTITLNRRQESNGNSDHGSYDRGGDFNGAQWKVISTKPSGESSDPFSKIFGSHRKKTVERDEEADYRQQNRMPAPQYGAPIPPTPSYGSPSPYGYQDIRSPYGGMPSYMSPYGTQSPPSAYQPGNQAYSPAAPSPYQTQPSPYNQYDNRNY